MLKRLLFTLLLVAAAATAPFANASSGAVSETYSADELVTTGGAFFGSISQGLASVVENAVSQFGLPNGYVLGEEAGGALIVGARYGQGMIYTRNAGEMPVYWQGPSIGLDAGGAGSKVMMLVYNLDSIQQVFGRFPGIDGSAYVVGGFGMTVIKYRDVVMVPIRAGLGARLGVNVGYLKITQEPDWNPF
jgi:hypothetical protein